MQLHAERAGAGAVGCRAADTGERNAAAIVGFYNRGSIENNTVRAGCAAAIAGTGQGDGAAGSACALGI